MYRKVILTFIVGICALASTYTLYTTTDNYVEAAKATHNLGGQLIDLQITAENTISLTFQFDNTSSLDIVLQKIAFNLYANGKFLGNYDRRERTLLTPGKAEITITAHVHPLYFEGLQKEQEFSEVILWYATGGAVIELPFEEMTVTMLIQEYWVTE
jgi:hypothetical protein